LISDTSYLLCAEVDSIFANIKGYKEGGSALRNDTHADGRCMDMVMIWILKDPGEEDGL